MFGLLWLYITQYLLEVKENNFFLKQKLMIILKRISEHNLFIVFCCFHHKFLAFSSSSPDPFNQIQPNEIGPKHPEVNGMIFI